MPYYFFFSYARANNDSYLQKFFDDLSEAIRDKSGVPRDAKVGFFDQRDLELGAEWDQELANALQTCPVLVSLYSPAYFNSEYCGKEWECFRKRRALYVERARAAGATVEPPPVIKQVIWIPLRPDQDPPPAVRGPQYTMGDPHATHNVEGLKTMRKRYANFDLAYDGFIDKLADEILDAVAEFSLPQGRQLSEWLDLDPPPAETVLPPLDPLPTLKEVESAFHLAAAEQQNTASPLLVPSRRTRGPKFVRFVMVAASPNEFPRSQRKAEFYLEYGGADWKPYLPEVDRTLMSVAQVVAGELDIRSDELAFTANLPGEIRAAEDNNSLVVIFVDGWTAELPSYLQVLTQFDEENYMNCSIFVPWNMQDPETAERSEYLKQLLKDVILRRWSRFANMIEPIFFLDINSLEELRDQLRVTLTKLQALVGKEVIERSNKDDMPRRIETDISKPILSHKDSRTGGVV